MAGTYNKATLVGRLGKDPEMKYAQSGKAITRFSLATDERTGTGESRTEWHNIVLFDRTAEVANEYLRKGSLVLIEGRIQTRSWDDQSGQKKYMTEIVGNLMQMLGSKADSGSPRRDDLPDAPQAGFDRPGPAKKAAPAAAEEAYPDSEPLPTDDDLPF